MIWTTINELIQTSASFLISSHVNPDGDCIGSQLALYWHLKDMGKDVTVFNRDPVPKKLRFLPGADLITTTRPQRTFDVLIVLDSSNPDRLGWNDYRSMAPKVVNIDHHADNTSFADLNFVDSSSAATGLILYKYLSETHATMSLHVAQALYTAIMTDTGGFRFSNTNGSVLRACADLCDKGANCADAYRNLYASDSPVGLLLKSRIWSTMSFLFDNRVCYMEMPIRLLEDIGANYGDSEGMADFTIFAEGVEVGVLIKYKENETHFSLRSTGKIDVGRIARSIAGGGGHGNAAGCTIYLPLDDAKKRMFGILEEELMRAGLLNKQAVSCS